MSADLSLSHRGGPLTAADIDAAAKRISGVVEPTPIQISERLSAATGATVYLKREDLQSVRSYKLRGAYNLLMQLSDDERAEVVAATLLKREGTPEHVAQAVVFLLENDFVTGVCLPVDGGRSIYAP